MKSALLSIVAVVFSLSMGEAMLRVAGFGPLATTAPVGGQWSEPDAQFGWLNRPGRFESSEAGNVAMNFGANRQRLSRPADASPAGPRIDIVGDSIAQGYGVADAETFAWRLGTLRPGWSVENLGVGGYGTYQSLLRLKARLADPPAAFVYGFFGDHQFRNVATLGWVTALRDAQGRNVVPPHATFADGRLAVHVGGPVLPWPLEHVSATVAQAHRAWLRFEFRGRRDMTRPATEALIAEMRDAAQSAGSRFLVLLLADAPDWLIPALDARKIAYADCRTPEFERDPALRVGGTGHPTAARHEAWAACLAPVLDALLGR